MRFSTPLAALLAVGIVFGLGALGLKWYSDAGRAERAQARAEARRVAEEERASEQAEAAEAARALRGPSSDIIPAELDGVQLGMTLDALQGVRTVLPKDDQRPGNLRFYEEMLTSHSQAVYGFDQNTERLVQLQVMSSVPPSAVAPHLQAMFDRYGLPTGIWNCPPSGAARVPMRRFTWRRDAVSMQDILLIHPQGVSLTLYIAPTETIRASLAVSHCAAVQTPEQLDSLPMATQEEMLQAMEQSQSTR